jgi:hypothetical protein
MKKFLLVFVVLFALLVFAGCEKLDSLEWEVLPKSVFVVDEKYDLDTNVQIRINGTPYTLGDAKNTFKDELTIIGFDLSQKGLGTLIIKYKTLSLYWAYQVIEDTEDLPKEVDEYVPSYGWFGEDGEEKEEYVLETPGDLYGFANIVNGRYDGYEGAYNFARKTVKLAADIDLTGKVWVPIGEGVRKHPKIVEDYVLEDNPDTYYEEDNVKYYFVEPYTYAVKNKNNDWVVYHCEDVTLENHNVFAGTFDGQGHTIKGLSDIGYTPTSTIYAKSEKVLRGYSFGLFGIVAGDVTIKNLNFENVQIVGTYYDAEKKEPSLATMDSVGAAIGYVAKGEGNLLVENVKVLSGFISGEDAIAGIVGRAYNYGNMTFKNLENRAQITSNGHAGGMVGYISRGEKRENVIKFINNANYGNIISSSKATGKAAGAIINFVLRANKKYVTFDGCRNFGNIVGMESNKSSLGLWSGAGADSYTINWDNCYNYGVLTYKRPAL